METETTSGVNVESSAIRTRLANHADTKSLPSPLPIWKVCQCMRSFARTRATAKFLPRFAVILVNA